MAPAKVEGLSVEDEDFNGPESGKDSVKKSFAIGATSKEVEVGDDEAGHSLEKLRP